ncbi:MAG: hypothetical protein ACR2NM_10505 [Bythopirellula sp.]
MKHRVHHQLHVAALAAADDQVIALRVALKLIDGHLVNNDHQDHQRYAERHREPRERRRESALLHISPGNFPE